jgi:TetR/AcrR family transcriptional regulator, repressor for lfrA
MGEVALIEGGARGRTRRAIIEAAMTVLADNPAAPLSDIAAAAGVGRSTLHRYFTERADLIRALALHVHELSTAAIVEAEPECGPPLVALRRVVEGQLDLGPIVVYVFTEPIVNADTELMAHLDTGDEVIAEMLAKVSTQPDTAPPGWARRAFWALLDAGNQAAKQDGTPKHRIVDAIMTTLTQGTITSDA